MGGVQPHSFSVTREVMAVIQVEVATLALDSQEQPVLVLRPMAGDPRHNRVLPVWIGVQEATAIMLATEGATAARPMSYDLMCRLLDALGASVRRVAVTALRQGTFYAEITLDTPAGTRVIDARPSDSIALAVRTHAPIFVAEDVMDEAGLPEESPDAAEAEPEAAEPEIAEFSHFLDTVDPDDFRG